MKRPTAEVLEGLRLLAAQADAGGPEDIGLDDGDEARWKAVLAATEWIRGLPDPPTRGGRR